MSSECKESINYLKQTFLQSVREVQTLIMKTEETLTHLNEIQKLCVKTNNYKTNQLNWGLGSYK